jgi:hypothetical protein
MRCGREGENNHQSLELAQPLPLGGDPAKKSQADSLHTVKKKTKKKKKKKKKKKSPLCSI